jgi:hypothetical protein
LLGLATGETESESGVQRRNQRPVLASRLLQAKKQRFQETKTARRMPCNPNRPNRAKELIGGHG